MESQGVRTERRSYFCCENESTKCQSQIGRILASDSKREMVRERNGTKTAISNSSF
jgi:hypothetical protein